MLKDGLDGPSDWVLICRGQEQQMEGEAFRIEAETLQRELKRFWYKWV